jgi:hypothetical protein
MRNRNTGIRMILAFLACGLLPVLQGCGEKSVHANVPALAPLPAEATRPMTVAPDTNAIPPQQALSSPPALPADDASNPPVLTIPSIQPAVPRKPSEQPASEASAEQPTHAPAPQITPELSAHDQASYQRRTNDDLNVAENNLHQASGKQLNAAQQDLVAKIRSFLTDSRDASKSGDWTRAQNLAQKARLLSVEFINSL